MSTFNVSGEVKRFPGKYGWYYVELDEDLSKDLRPLLKDRWPGLLNASFTVHRTHWNSSIMPIKDGPLFIALPVKVRKTEAITEGQLVTINFELKI